MRTLDILLAMAMALATFAPPAKSETITLDPVCRGTGFERGTEIAELVTQLREFDMTLQHKDAFAAYPLLAKLNNVVNSAATIDTFRCQDDLPLILKLVTLANTDNRTIRVNASRLLANVADNTTLCAVLDALAGDQQLNDDTRYNFWQVVHVVAGYARKENQDWIRAVIAKQASQLENERAAGEKELLSREKAPSAKDKSQSAKEIVPSQTLYVIRQTENKLRDNSRPESLERDFGVQYRACLMLPNLSKLPSPASTSSTTTP